MTGALNFRTILHVQVMLLIFLFIGTLLIAGFLGYHCSLIARGMTSYETFKWQDYKDHCMEVARDSRCLPCSSWSCMFIELLHQMLAC